MRIMRDALVDKPGRYSDAIAADMPGAVDLADDRSGSTQRCPAVECQLLQAEHKDAGADDECHIDCQPPEALPHQIEAADRQPDADNAGGLNDPKGNQRTGNDASAERT
jgi:hypothetical protein